MVFTLFFEANDLSVGAEAVPRSAVVDCLEISGDDVTHGQGGNHPFLRADRLHSVASGCPGLQHCLLPWPGLRDSEHVLVRGLGTSFEHVHFETFYFYSVQDLGLIDFLKCLSHLAIVIIAHVLSLVPSYYSQ